MRPERSSRNIVPSILALGALALALRGCQGRPLQPQQLAAGQMNAHVQQHHQPSPWQGWSLCGHQHLAATAQAAASKLQKLSSRIMAHTAAGAGTADVYQRLQRSLLGFTPSQHEQHTAAKHAAKVSGWHAASVGLMCLFAMVVLGFMAYKAMQWYERTRRPGYVELQALDNAFHKPTFTL